jgi:transmembrane sensor
MERPVRAHFNTQIHEEACEWFIECRAGDLDGAARAEFDRWLRKSPEHLSAYLEIAAIWNEGPTLDPGNRWDLDTLISQASEEPGNIVALERRPRPPAPAQEPERIVSNDNQEARGLLGANALEPQHGRKGGRRHLFSIAASIVLVTAGLATYLLASGGVYATTVGEQRSLALADGSTVQLNSLSRIRVRYSDHERIVELLQGQALFRVAKDAARPFVVRSDETRVQAVGTQFDVYRKVDGTVVTVVEGSVALSEGRGEPEGINPPNQGSGTALPAAIVLAAGEQITVTPKAARRTPHPNVAGATAWTQRQLVFDSASLSEVAGEFNRYNERKLVIDASALGTLHISGVFSSTDPASLIRFLRDRPGLRVTETAKEIRVEKEP